MFWRERGENEKGKQKKKKAVKKIDGALWGYMVSQGVIVDILQNLRRVERDGAVGGKQVIVIRIFHPAIADKRGVAIEDYDSLDSHPELILYEGYYLEIGGQARDIHIEKK